MPVVPTLVLLPVRNFSAPGPRPIRHWPLRCLLTGSCCWLAEPKHLQNNTELVANHGVAGLLKMFSQRLHVFIFLYLIAILLHAGPETGEPDTMIVQQRKNHCGAAPHMVVWETGFVGWSGVQFTIWSAFYWHYLITWHWPLRGYVAWFAFGNVLPLFDLLTLQDFLVESMSNHELYGTNQPFAFFRMVKYCFRVWIES